MKIPYSRIGIVGATASLLALPATGSAHNATIACDLSNPGAYLVQPDYLQLSPVTTFGPTSATVIWRDGYRVVLPYPAGCVAPPPPSVVPPVMPELSPAPPPPNNFDITPPAPVTPAPVEPMGRKKATPRKPVTCRYLLANRAGKWSYVARGFYPFCRAPKPPRKYLARVPVTG